MNKLLTNILCATAVIALLAVAIAIPNYRIDVANNNLKIQARKTNAVVCQLNALRKRLFKLDDSIKYQDASDMLEAAIPYIVSVKKNNNGVLQLVGTGFIFNSERGYIITAYHVVDGAKKEILSADKYSVGINMADVEVVDIYAGAQRDFAVIIINTNDPNYCNTGQLNIASTNGKIGEEIFAIGHPFRFKNSISKGIISNISNCKYLDYVSGSRDLMTQIDAAVNPGNSGGAVINLDGDVIGLVVGTWSFRAGNLGINFAIPASELKKCLTRFDKWSADKEFKSQLEKAL